MKTYQYIDIEADSVEWVPADVAEGLYEALFESNRHLIVEFGINHPLVKANMAALSKARGEME